jgi:hypothetical protein
LPVRKTVIGGHAVVGLEQRRRGVSHERQSMNTRNGDFRGVA